VGKGLAGGEGEPGLAQTTLMLDTTHLESIGHGFEVGGISGEGIRRGPPVVSAGRTAPASCWPGSTHRWRGKLHGVLEKGLGVPTGLESRRGHGLGKACPAATAGARIPASWRHGLSNKRAG
jgi:hypothetical protein